MKTTPRFSRWLCALGVLASGALLLSACSSSSNKAGTPTVSQAPTGASQAPTGATGSSSDSAATGTPIKVGWINAESGTLGNPDISAGADAAVAYVNAHGGVNGHPITLDKCATDSTPAGSGACGAKLAANGDVAVLGGSDQSADASLPPLEQAKILYSGTQPTTPKVLTSPIAFDFVGGAQTAYPAEAKFIAETLHAKKVAIIYADVTAGLEVAQNSAQKALTAAGVQSKLVPAPYTGGDLSAQVTIATQYKPDVIWTIQTPASCGSVMQAVATQGITTPTIYNGACASEAVLKAGGAGAKNAYFETQFLPPTDTSNADVALYRAAMAANSKNPVYNSNSQAGFTGVMNLTAVMKAASTGVPTSADLISYLQKGETTPGFMTHDFTCDGKQFPGAPAFCNPYHKIIQWDGSELKVVTPDWIDGADLMSK